MPPMGRRRGEVTFTRIEPVLPADCAGYRPSPYSPAWKTRSINFDKQHIFKTLTAKPKAVTVLDSKILFNKKLHLELPTCPRVLYRHSAWRPCYVQEPGSSTNGPAQRTSTKTWPVVVVQRQLPRPDWPSLCKSISRDFSGQCQLPVMF